MRNRFRMWKNRLDLLRYDDYTISAYFRKLGANIGQNNRIMVRSLGESPYLVMIGNHCTISSDVIMLTHDGGGWLFTDEIVSLQKFGTIRVLDNSFIGMRTIILPDVTIGPNSIVGAGSIVTKNVPPNTVVAGNPTRVISDIDSYRERVLRLWEQQKPPTYLEDFEDGITYPPEEIEAAKKRDMHLLEDHLSRIFWGNDGGVDSRP